MNVTYDGKNYFGFQKQNNKNTIQNKLEDALKIIFKQEICTTASGRTDAKVSAYNQPVHFEIDCKIDKNKFLHSINGILPNDIRVLDINPTNVHVRFSAKKKTYLYKMYQSKISLPLSSNRLQISTNLNVNLMKKFLKLIKGTHDFSGFRASGSDTESSVRTIFDAKLIKHGNNLDFYITGNGFLYKMVRNIVGTMIKVGEGKINLKELKPILFSSYKSIHTAKPEFLYLYNVKY